VSNWLEKLEEQGRKARREKRKELPRSPVQEVIVGVRPCSANDPGQVEVGYFVVSGDTVTLTNADGEPLKDENCTAKIGDANPRSVASVMVRKRWEGTRGGGDFNRPLGYPKSGWS
jgi:hypothetical protein